MAFFFCSMSPLYVFLMSLECKDKNSTTVEGKGTHCNLILYCLLGVSTRTIPFVKARLVLLNEWDATGGKVVSDVFEEKPGSLGS